MRTKAVRFAPTYHRQAFKVGGRFRFWGGLTVEAVGGGLGLVDTLSASAERAGITLRYQARAIALTQRGGQISGVQVRTRDGNTEVIPADAVVLASGGFQANAAWRTRYLGPGWDLAKVRGTRFNTGDGIRMALDIGARSTGNWSGCHAVGWDRNAPEFGDRVVGDGSRSTVTRSASWSPPTGSGSWTRAPTSATSPMPATDRHPAVRGLHDHLRHHVNVRRPGHRRPHRERAGRGGHPIPGLFACGELVGGLFYFNYPGGAGLTSGAVFGRLAGTQAARHGA